MSKPLCDLCGQPPRGPRHDGAEFEIEGLICRQCREDLADERAVARTRELAGLRYHNPSSPDGRLYAGPESYHLMVLNPWFSADDLTLRARCRLMVAEVGRTRRAAS